MRRLLIAAVFTSFVACNCGEDQPPPTPDGGEPGETLGWASGLVVDDEESPVADAQVFVGADEGKTGSDGRFRLALTTLGVRGLVVRAGGFAKTERALAINEQGNAFAGTVMLSPLTGSAKVGAAGGEVSGTGLVVKVPAGAFANEVTIEAALVPVGDMLLDDLRLPGAIPTPAKGAIAPMFAVVIDAGGVQPSAALEVTLAGAIALPDGTQVPVGRFDTATGAWVDAGVALASAAGLVFQVDHLSMFAGALPAVPDASAKTPELDGLDKVPTPFLAGEPRVDPKSGALQVGVDLPALERRGRKVGLTLFHDSRTAKPVLTVPVVLPEAPAGQTVVVGATTETTSMRALVEVTKTATALEPMVVVTDIVDVENSAPPVSGTHDVVTHVSRGVPATVATSTNGSFTQPVSGPLLEPVKTQVALRASVLQTVAVDDRSESPFGNGWHLRGLTRLVQPWCGDASATLAGGYETPAISFAPNSELYLTSVDTKDLPLEGLQRSAMLAWSGGKLYVGLDRDNGGNEGASVWRFEVDGTATRVVGKPKSEGGQAGCGVAKTSLYLDRLAGLGTGPDGDGIMFASENCIFHLKADDNLSLVGGGGGENGKTPAVGVLATEVEFREELMQVIGGRAPGVFALRDYAKGDFMLRDGVLEQRRTKVNHTHGHIGAIDAEGRFFYTALESPCLYEHDDGLNDQPVFASCVSGLPAELEDGPKETAKVGHIGSVAFDAMGRMWFYDVTFKALRRLDTDGTVTTISGNKPGELSGEGGLASSATLGSGRFEVAADSKDELAIVADKALLRFVPPPGGALAGLGAGDQSTLTRAEDGSWKRVLSDGVEETYDRAGLLLRRAAPGEPGLTFEYGDWEILPDVQHCNHPVSPPLLKRVTFAGETLFSFEWSGKRLVSVTDEAGRRTSVEVADGRVRRVAPPGDGGVSFAYDEDGRITERRSPAPTGGQVTWRYGYENGRVVEVTVPGRGVVSFESAEGAVAIAADGYSPANIARNVKAGPANAKLTTSKGGTASVTLGVNSLTVKNPAGDASKLEMDAFGRLTREERPDGTTISYTRDPAGRIVELRNETTKERWLYKYNARGLLERHLDPSSRQATFQYDDQGRLTRRIEPDGAGVRFTWNTSGSGAANGLPATMTDALGRTTTYTYDDRGNLVRMVAPGELVTEMSRDKVGRVVRLTGPDGLERRFSHDDRDGLLTQSRGNPTENLDVVYTRAVADGWESVGSHVPASAMTRAVDEEGRAWRFDRDNAFQLTTIETPGEGRVTQTFDALGRRVNRQTEDGSAETTEWDDEGRIERRVFSGVATGSELAYEWDELGRVKTLRSTFVREDRRFAPGIGWDRVQVFPQRGLPPAATFEILRARPTPATESLEVGKTRYTQHRAFDGLVEMVERERTDQQGTRQTMVTFGWNAARQLQTVTRANGVNTTRIYDDAGRVLHQDEGSIRLSWTYDEAGRPATRTQGDVTRTYHYDDDNKLSSCSDTDEAFTWTRSGARASAGENSYERDERGRLTSDGESDYAWDVVGRRVGRTAKADPQNDFDQFVYGAAGLLSEVKHNGTSVATFRYDGTGRRIEKATAEGSHLYGYLPDTDRPVRIVEPDGTTWHLSHAWSSAPFTFATTAEGKARYVHVDPFERVIGVSDEGGILHLVDEDCFGRPLSGTPPSGPRLGFHGMTWDAETGLYQAGARYYDPHTGEFLSSDPEGIEAGTAPWNYADGNPVLKADPSGRFPFLIVGALFAGAKIAHEIVKYARSDEVKRARQSYKDMTDDVFGDDDKLKSAEKGHKRLHKAADKGGDVAVKATKIAVDAVTNPINDLKGMRDAVISEAKEAVQDAVSDPPKSDDGEGGSDDPA